MAFLRIMSGDMKGRTFDIERDEIIMGRSPENTIALDDPAVSSRHCAVLRDGRRFTLKDMNSTNGTRLNNSSVKESRLNKKDVITVGAVDIMFDGDDIEPFESVKPVTGPQGTVKLSPAAGSTSPIGNGSPFGTKKDTRIMWILAMSAMGLLAGAALCWFLMRLFGGGAK